MYIKVFTIDMLIKVSRQALLDRLPAVIKKVELRAANKKNLYKRYIRHRNYIRSKSLFNKLFVSEHAKTGFFNPMAFSASLKYGKWRYLYTYYLNASTCLNQSSDDFIELDSENDWKLLKLL